MGKFEVELCCWDFPCLYQLKDFPVDMPWINDRHMVIYVVTYNMLTSLGFIFFC